MNEAIAELETSIELAPMDPGPCFLLGDLLSEQGSLRVAGGDSPRTRIEIEPAQRDKLFE